MDLRYGIYFIPPAGDEFYEIGSRFLRYDIRREKLLYNNLNSLDYGPILQHFGSAHYFGFHATIRGTFKTNKLSYLEEHISSIAQEFAPIKIENSFLSAFTEKR
jgi:hypothetical protein